jgi:hypothetical protein
LLLPIGKTKLTPASALVSSQRVRLLLEVNVKK